MSCNDCDTLRTLNGDLQKLYDEAQVERAKMKKSLMKTIKQNRRLARQNAELRGVKDDVVCAEPGGSDSPSPRGRT